MHFKPLGSGSAAIPEEIFIHSLFPGAMFAAARGESLSQFYEARRRGEIEAPAVEEPRFVRWTGAQIRANLIQRVEQAKAGAAAHSDGARERAIRALAAASAAIQAKRPAGVAA